MMEKTKLTEFIQHLPRIGENFPLVELLSIIAIRDDADFNALDKTATLLNFSMRGPYSLDLEFEVPQLKISKRTTDGFKASIDNLNSNINGPLIVIYRRCLVPEDCIINHALPHDVYQKFRKDQLAFEAIINLVSSSLVESIQVVRTEIQECYKFAFIFHGQNNSTLAINRKHFSETPEIADYLIKDESMLSLIRGTFSVSEPVALLPLLHSVIERLAGTSRGEKIGIFLKEAGACEEILEDFRIINDHRNDIMHRESKLDSAIFFSANERSKMIISLILSGSISRKQENEIYKKCFSKRLGKS